MAFQLLETVRGYLTPHLFNKTSEHFGEFTSNISKASTAAVPAVLSTLITSAEKGGAPELLRKAREVSESNVLIDTDRLTDDLSFNKGWETFSEIAEGQTGTIIENLSSLAGIKKDSAQGLVGMATQLGLAVLGRHAVESRFTPQELTSFLHEERATVMSAVPAILAPGNNIRTDAEPSRTESLRSGQTETRKRIGRLPYLAVGLLVIFAGAYVYFLNKPLVHSKTQSEPATTITTLPATEPGPAATTRQYGKIKLVNGVVINAYHGGIEDQLIACLNNTACVAGANQWFDFDNINFETNSARLTPASMEQVQNIAAILKAYPNTKIKIGGYTDKTGSAATNQQLSQQRAEAVLNAIKNVGANPAQLVGAEGYGSQFAKAPATAPDEERRKDRRIAISLREK